MIRFSKYLWLYFLISGLVLVPGIFSLLRYGLRPSVDFTGGTLLEFRLDNKKTSRSASDIITKSNLPVVSMQTSGADMYVLRIKSEGEKRIPIFREQLGVGASAAGEITRVETVGPVLGRELLQKAIVAAALAILAILAYVAYAFKNIKFGVSAVVALLHDLFVVVGIFSILGVWKKVEVDTLFVTAFLTTMSFSVHDTIVVFDRIRELLKKGTRGRFEDISDRAMTETIGRSFTNSMTIVFMLLALILLGGETIRWFVVALLIGTVSGTYSSPFVATPVLILWDRWEKRKRRK